MLCPQLIFGLLFGFLLSWLVVFWIFWLLTLARLFFWRDFSYNKGLFRFFLHLDMRFFYFLSRRIIRRSLNFFFNFLRCFSLIFRFFPSFFLLFTLTQSLQFFDFQVDFVIFEFSDYNFASVS